MPNCCDATDLHFGEKHARRDLRRYLENGPDRTTRFLIDGLTALGWQGVSLLDVGAGVGVLHHELMPETIARTTHVDLSTAYMDTARMEAVRRGHADNLRFVHGDLVSCADELPESDIVTLDRVVCCYPDFPGLLDAALVKCRRALALTYPRDRLLSRFLFTLDNLKRVIKRDAFRAYVHPDNAIEGLIHEAGFVRRSTARTFFWKSSVFVRENEPS